MTTTPTARPAPSAERADEPRGWFRGHRTGLLIGAALVVATGVAILSGTRAPYSAELDPANAAPDGARAVARVLEHEGVDVEIVRDADLFDAARLDGSATVVVTSTGNLGRSTFDRMSAHLDGARLILVDPPVRSLELFDIDGGVRIPRPGTVTGFCDDPRFDALRIRVDRATAFLGAPQPCFSTPDGALLATYSARSLTVLGAGELLSNDQITRADNAAVALRLLGATARVVWYVPNLEDLSADDSVGLGSLLPDWLDPALWLVALALVAVVVWRGRRLGPLVTEPLPVVVTAIESTESRGRLYRKVSDRAHAAEILRRSARSRLAAHLGLPRRAVHDPETLVRDVAAHSGRDVASVQALLAPDSGAAPRSDKELTQLANDLAELDREVRRS